jgi:protein-S-isoprenylcysteine O-methyltransferase Ste14
MDWNGILGIIIALGIITLVFFGMALIVVGKQFTHRDWIGLIGVLVLLLGAFVATYGVLSPTRRITSPSRNPPNRQSCHRSTRQRWPTQILSSRYQVLLNTLLAP